MCVQDSFRQKPFGRPAHPAPTAEANADADRLLATESDLRESAELLASKND